MSATTLPPPRAAPRPGDGAVLAALAAALAVLLLTFREEGTAAMRVWAGSTAYSHCYFVLPIALWLAWERRACWAATSIVSAPWAALLALPIGLAWFGAERLGVMEGRQLTAMALVETLFLGALGWRMWRAFAAPLLYLFFLVPFGAFFVPALQDVTTWFIVNGLDLLGISNFTDGYTIDTVAGSFYVAEACAGLRFLIASIAFGALYACLIYRSPTKRLAFMAASVAIPIVANGLRGLGIVVLGDYLGSAEAAAADHLLYGWIFFSLVILLLILAGLPFREDGERVAPAALADRPPPRAPALAGAAFAVVLVAAAAPVGAGLLDRLSQTAAPPTVLALATPSGCEAGAPVSEGGRTVQPFRCGGETLTARVEMFARRASPARLFAALREAAGESGTADVSATTLAVPGLPGLWRLVETEEPAVLTATALWIDGTPAAGGLADRRRLALASLGMAAVDIPPVLVSVRLATARPQFGKVERERLVGLVIGLLAAQTALPAEIAAAR